MDFRPMSVVLVLAALALAFFGIRLCLRWASMSRRRPIHPGDEAWISGRLLKPEGEMLSWLTGESAGWIERSVHLELRPRPGRATIDPRFKEVEELARDRPASFLLAL